MTLLKALVEKSGSSTSFCGKQEFLAIIYIPTALEDYNIKIYSWFIAGRSKKAKQHL